MSLDVMKLEEYGRLVQASDSEIIELICLCPDDLVKVELDQLRSSVFLAHVGDDGCRRLLPVSAHYAEVPSVLRI